MAPRLSEITLAPLAPPDARERALLVEAAKYIEHSAEEWYHSARRKYGHSRLLLEPVILKPVCDDCLARFDLPTSLERCWKSTKARDLDLVVLPEKTKPDRLTIYDRGSRLAYLWRAGSPPGRWPGVQCSDCHQTIEDSDDIFAVYEEPFAEYCGLPDPEDALKSLRGSKKKMVRERLARIYGRRCFECGKRRKLTLDHIQPQSRGGTWLTTNLQPFCEECQLKKADLQPTKVIVALDMLLRPPPSDSFDGLFW
jgi:HNH endonuclease